MGRGAEGIHIASIVTAFEKMGHKVTVVSPPGVDPMKTIGENPLDKTDDKVKGLTSIWKTISQKAPQITFEFLEIAYNFSAIFKIKKIIEKKNIDFIYERNAFFLFTGAFISRKYNIPLVVEANEVVGIKRARPLVMKKIAKLVEKYTLNNAYSIFTVSSYLKNLIVDVVNRSDNVYITPNAVDPLHYSKKTRRDEIRSEYGLTNKVVIGFAGWFDWWDRLDLLIDAQKEIKTKGCNSVATFIIGDGPECDELKKHALFNDIKDDVVFTGAVDRKEVIDYIDALDIGVFSHSNEFGSPVVLFEMMALGKSIIAPDLKPITDVLEHNKNGLIFPALDQNLLTENILRLASDDEKRKLLGDNAKYKTLNEYTWENNSKKILKSIEKV